MYAKSSAVMAVSARPSSCWNQTWNVWWMSAGFATRCAAASGIGTAIEDGALDHARVRLHQREAGERSPVRSNVVPGSPSLSSRMSSRASVASVAES